MKKTLLLLAVYTLPFYVQAQITLNSTNAPTDAQCQIPDTFNRVKLNTLPDVSPKANATWDMTLATDSNIYTYNYNKAAASSAFPTATFIIPRQYIVTPGMRYDFDAMCDVNTNGIVYLGEHIDRQALPLAALTGDNADSLIFVTQDITYNMPEHDVKYPCTMGTKWTDDVTFSTNFILTVTSAGLNNTPGQRKTRRVTDFEVTGWGKMRVNDRNGNPTGYMDVLAIDRIETVSDSFFLGGAPAPPTLLAAFGLTQGQQITTYDRKYYRDGEYRGLLEIEYQDAAFTKPIEIITHNQRLKPTSVDELKLQGISIYPNPVTNSSFTVRVKGTQKELSYQLLNITGQQVAAGNVPANGNISLQDNLPAGIYVIKLTDADGAYGVERINIVK